MSPAGGPRAHRAASGVERLGPFRMLEHRFALHVTDPVLAEWCRSAFSPLRSDEAELTYTVTRTGPDAFDVVAGSRPVVRAIGAGSLLTILIGELNRRAAASARDHLLLHAAVVGAPGGAVVVAAPSGAGKSTLVATRVRSGHPYGGDEHGAIHFEDGLVDPVPKPLALKFGSAVGFPQLRPEPAVAPFMLNQLFVAPGDLGSGVLDRRVPVVGFVVSEHRPGASPTVERVSPASAVMALRENSFNFGRDPRRGLRTLSSLVRDVPLLHVVFGEAMTAWSAIDDHGEW